MGEKGQGVSDWIEPAHNDRLGTPRRWTSAVATARVRRINANTTAKFVIQARRSARIRTKFSICCASHCNSLTVNTISFRRRAAVGVCITTSSTFKTGARHAPAGKQPAGGAGGLKVFPGDSQLLHHRVQRRPVESKTRGRLGNHPIAFAEHANDMLSLHFLKSNSAACLRCISSYFG
jgi:hypothetical protein